MRAACAALKSSEAFRGLKERFPTVPDECKTVVSHPGKGPCKVATQSFSWLRSVELPGRMSSPAERRTASPTRRRPVSMEEYTGRERSHHEIQQVRTALLQRGERFKIHSTPLRCLRVLQEGLTQEALVEVLRNQHQNIVQQQNLIAGQGAQISELTKLVSGLVQMQTDVLKDQAQREADERERKAEEERKAAEEAATSSTPERGSLFTSAPKKSDPKYSGSSGGKMESYIPNCPQLEIKYSGRRHEINTWLSFRERFGSWLCPLEMSATQRNCKRQ